VGNWTEIRAAARSIVQETFGVPAQYTPPGIGAVPVAVTVRFRSKNLQFGDLIREGYAKVVEDINQIVLQKSEVSTTRLGVVTLANGARYKLDLRVPDDGSDFATWDVEQLT
jgi:hypothetical protein